MNEGRAKQIEVLRRMTPEAKWGVLVEMHWSARRLKAAWFRKQHPDWSEEEIRGAVDDAFLVRRG